MRFSIRCEPGFLAYVATKEAIRVLTKTAAKEWGKHKIRVNTILPSALTPKSIWYLEDSGTYDQELAKVAMGRFGEPRLRLGQRATDAAAKRLST